MTSYDRRFYIFQLSKLVGILAIFLGLGAVLAWRDGTATQLAVAVGATVLLSYVAYRMARQYRCTNPACNRPLLFAHGSSAFSGHRTHVSRCPFCGERFGSGEVPPFTATKGRE